jgi:septum site-determining protein MinC
MSLKNRHSSSCAAVVDTLLFVKTTDLDALRAELVKRFEATPEFFADDVVAIDVRRLAEGERVALSDIRQMLNDVRMRPVGVVAQASQAWAAEAGLPLLEARDRRGATAKPEPADEAEPRLSRGGSGSGAGTGAGARTERAHDGCADAGDRPAAAFGPADLREGDLVVLAPVSHGAEIIAEGNIHIYAPLRGRALAGVHGNHDARIFCTCLEPELISIAGIYRPPRTRCPPTCRVSGADPARRGKLMIEPLRLT